MGAHPGLVMLMLHSGEDVTCPILTAPDNYHFEMRCEDCDVQRMARLTFEQVESLYYDGRITQDEFEAYAYLHDLLSPYRGTPPATDFPAVRRIARKLARARGLAVPAELIDVAVELIA